MQNVLTQDHLNALDRLRAAVASHDVTQQQIAEASGVDQSQVSRILAGQTKRVSANVIKLCKFAYEVELSGGHDPSQSQALMNALRVVWDGSSAHAEAIAQVLFSLRHFKEKAS